MQGKMSVVADWASGLPGDKSPLVRVIYLTQGSFLS